MIINYYLRVILFIFILPFIFPGCGNGPVLEEDRFSLNDYKKNMPILSDQDSKEVIERLYRKKTELRKRKDNFRMVTHLKVPDDYPTIQAAVDAAPHNTVIKVAEGIYNELVEIVVDDISILGKGVVNLQGAIIMISDRAEIKNINIEVDHYIHGIHIIDSEEVNIINNSVIGDGATFFGIFMDNSLMCKVKKNSVRNTNQGGILSYESNNSLITQNEVSGQSGGSGITLWRSVEDRVINNVSNFNPDAGIILLDNANRNTISRNELLSNTLCDIIIGPTCIDNTFSNNNFVCIQE